jgi:hypothetical protein
MTDNEQAPRPAAVRRAGLRDVAGRGAGRQRAGRSGAGSGGDQSADRRGADPGRVTVDRHRLADSQPAGTYTNGGFAYGYYGYTNADRTAHAYGYYRYAQADGTVASAHAVLVVRAYPDTQGAATHAATRTTDSIPAAGGFPDAGSDSRANANATADRSADPRPDLRERRGQRRRDGDDLRGRDNVGRGDGPGVPRRGRRPASGVLLDDLLGAGHVGYGVRRDGQRWRRNAALFGDGRWVWLLLSGVVRRLGGGRNAGRDDLYVVGIERRDGESLQRLRERRRRAGGLLGAGVMA